MLTKKDFWELTIVDSLPPVVELHSFVVGKLEKDGPNVMVTGGMGGLFLYYGDDYKRVTIADRGFFHVGLTLEDVDGDGVLEIITSEQMVEPEYVPIDELRADKKQLKGGIFKIVGYKMGNSYEDEWTKFELDSECMGNPHDIYFTDIDGDGRNEMIAVSAYSVTPGLYLYQNPESLDKNWSRTPIMEGHLTEGIAVADLNGDGKLEIVSGPDWYVMPEDGPFSGVWKRGVYAPSNRDMCRVGLIDLTGNGKLDIVNIESEYKEGRLCWYENFTDTDAENPWKEHFVEDGFTFAHSIKTYVDEKTGENKVFIAEMVEGGWAAMVNFNARILLFTVSDNGNTWTQKEIYHGVGTHQTTMYDIDGDGDIEVVGKSWQYPTVHIFKEKKPSKILNFKHSFIDRDKRETAIDIFAVDVDGDGVEDVVCGNNWYKAPDWQRFEIPNIYQVINHYDIDGDGNDELICIKRSDADSEEFYPRLSSDFYWIKAVDAENGVWEEYKIGKGSGSWPHGTLIDAVLPDNKVAFMAAYHSAKDEGDYPDIFEVPDDPKEPWKRRTLANIEYGEDLKVFGSNKKGFKDILAGNYLLENQGNGEFSAKKIFDDIDPARVCVADINGNGKMDIVAGDEILGEPKRAKFSKLAWFEEIDQDEPWKMHIIDTLRCAHSIAMVDIDGDGVLEIVVGEHDSSNPYRNSTRLYVYKKADDKGEAWNRFTIDDRFEHHNGVKVINLKNGNLGIISHGWSEKQFVHLWEFEK